MRKIVIMLALLLLAGCSAESADAPKNQKKKGETPAKTIEYTVDELKEVTGLDEMMEEECEGFYSQFEQANLRGEKHKPSLMAICGIYSSENGAWEKTYLKIADPYDDGEDAWIFTEVGMTIAHPISFIGNIKTEDGKEIAILNTTENDSNSGAVQFLYIYYDEDNVSSGYEVVPSENTIYGNLRIEDNKIIVDDKVVTETFTYKDGKFVSKAELKELANTAEKIIYYDKDENGSLVFSEVGALDVQPGDRISFRRKRPLQLDKFQIRGGSLELDTEDVETFIVTEESMGTTIVAGEYPFYDMTEFTIGRW